MLSFRDTITRFVCSGLLLVGTKAYGRQNILIGEVSVRYDHQERTYDDSGLVTVSPDGAGGEIVAGAVGDTGSGPTVVVLEDLRGDRQRYILSPRLRFSSNGLNDVLEMTYAPSLNYDQIYETTDLDHDFGLRAVRNLKRNWSITLNNQFFLGDDPIRENQLRTAVIMPTTGEPVVEEPVVGSPAEESQENLTERYGRRRYWTNSLDLRTDYDYGNARRVSVGYNFSLLRNDESDAVGGFSEYDRHTGFLGLNHRFTRKWRADGELRYRRGQFDDRNLFVVTPGPEDALVDGDSVQVNDISGIASDELSEYRFRVKGGYDTSPRLRPFTEYSYLSTDYDAALREDYQVHNIAMGVDYDITSRLHITLSGGPSWGSFENSPTESDYNAYAGLTWQYMRGALTFFADKGYDQSNFDGRRSGLTDFWRTGVTMDYQLTQALTATVSSYYRDNSRLQFPAPQTIVIVDGNQPDPVQPAGGINQTEYTEKDYDAVFSLAYTFLRWYTLSGGYRYYKFESDLAEGNAGSYDEHRAFIQLTVSKELLRW